MYFSSCHLGSAISPFPVTSKRREEEQRCSVGSCIVALLWVGTVTLTLLFHFADVHKKGGRQVHDKTEALSSEEA